MMSDIERILTQTSTIAVMWANPRDTAPAHYVPAYMATQGYRVYPIHPAAKHANAVLWEQPMLPSLGELPEAVDMVNIFRRAERIIDFVPEILAMASLPKVAWFQLGLRNEEAAQLLREAGIEVVQDRCLLMDHKAWSRSR